MWIRDGEDTIVKIFVTHDTLPVSFNSIEYARACNDLNDAVSVSPIQTSSTSEAGYLLGSCKTTNDSYWGPLMNANPKLNNIDVNIVTKKIEVNSSTPWNPKTDARASHVYYVAEQEDKLNNNKVLCNMYNKKHKWMNTASNLSEGNVFHYVPFRMKKKIALTAH